MVLAGLGVRSVVVLVGMGVRVLCEWAFARFLLPQARSRMCLCAASAVPGCAGFLLDAGMMLLANLRMRSVLLRAAVRYRVLCVCSVSGIWPRSHVCTCTRMRC